MSHKLKDLLILSRGFLLTLVLIPSIVLSQPPKPREVPEAITEAIAKDVWHPFMEAYRALDVEKFKSIHASDVTRVSIDMNKIENKSDYFNNLDGFFNNVKSMSRQMDIRFSIVSSATGDDKVYQTGYYCFSSRGSDSEAFQPRAYGFFNVILIKENDVWKIALDADKHVTMGEDEFRTSGKVYELK